MEKLTKLEQETILIFNEAEKTAEIETYCKPMMRKLRKLAVDYPDTVKLTRRDKGGSEFYVILKELISIRAPSSAEYKEACRQRALASKFWGQTQDGGLRTYIGWYLYTLHKQRFQNAQYNHKQILRS